MFRSLLTGGLYDYKRLWDTEFVYRTRVVAVNRLGREFTLFPVSSYREAVEKRDRLRRELDEVSVEAWCDRYVVPGGFVDGSWTR
jgi:hypothetical protein